MTRVGSKIRREKEIWMAEQREKWREERNARHEKNSLAER